MAALPDDDAKRDRHVVNGRVTDGVNVQGKYVRVLETITLQLMFEHNVATCLVHVYNPPDESGTPVMVNVIEACGIAVILVRYHICIEHNKTRRIMMG